MGILWIAQQQGWVKDAQTTQTTNNIETQIESEYFKVIKFEDGDTISVDIEGKKESIRLIGVDTPETKDPRKPVQCYGQAASNFTKNLIGNNSVKLVSDSTNSDRDRYNRLLRYVYLPDGTLVNAEIIKQGFGFAYLSFQFEKMDEFKQYEQNARNYNLGLWGNCQLITDNNGSFSSAPAE